MRTESSPAGEPMTKIMACLEEELPPGAKKNINLLGRTVLLTNVDGNFYAVDGICPDVGGNLADGTLRGHVLKCPLHGSEFDVRTGQILKGPWTDPKKLTNLRSYPIIVEEGCVNVEI
jgi:nitrite reductase/ring-hydroxylating ferredoxin subunit